MKNDGTLSAFKDFPECRVARNGVGKIPSICHSSTGIGTSEVDAAERYLLSIRARLMSTRRATGGHLSPKWGGRQVDFVG